MLSFYLSTLETPEQKEKCEMLYEKYLGLMLYEANKRMPNKQDVEEVVHDAFIRLIKKIDDLRIENNSELVSYIKRVVHSCATDKYRKLKKESIADTDELEFHDMKNHKDNEKIMIDDIAIKNLISAIKKFPEIYRLPLKLNIVDDYTAPEIAKILDLPLTTTKMRIYRGKNMLKAVYEGEINEQS